MIPLARSSLPRFPSRHYFLAPSHPLSFSFSISTPFLLLSSRLLHHLRALQRRPISRYPLTCRRFFTRDTFPPFSNCAPFLLPEGHWNRIKLYAGFSMPPFPSVAMKSGIRHSGRSGRRNGEISFERGQTKFPWPLIRHPDIRVAMEKRGLQPSPSEGTVAANPIDRGGQREQERAIQRKKSARHCCLLCSRLSGKINVSGLFLPTVLLASSIPTRLPTSAHKL